MTSEQRIRDSGRGTDVEETPDEKKSDDWEITAKGPGKNRPIKGNMELRS